jgi:hypothetical protein
MLLHVKELKKYNSIWSPAQQTTFFNCLNLANSQYSRIIYQENEGQINGSNRNEELMGQL